MNTLLLSVYKSLLTDAYRLTGVRMDLPVDLDANWVLIEAPKLDKDVLRYLEEGGLKPSLPTWLQPLWDEFLVENDWIVLQVLRTILVFGYKIEHEPTQEQLSNAQKAFEDASKTVEAWDCYFNSSDLKAPIYREARRLVANVIGRICWTEISPSHGPGAVFPQSDPCDKGDFVSNTLINEYYPYDRHFNMLPSLGSHDLMSSTHVPVDSIHCKMVAVPKDSRGPRLICVHPKEAIWIQQGQRRLLEDAIESHKLTRGRINFRDQSVNGSLALKSSGDRLYCTIDLKEASDHVSKSLTDYLFGWSSRFLNCTRASHVRLLDNRLLELRSFAPMGNCLTFPVESLVFWSLVRAGIVCRHGQYCDDVYVFGDDIIIPTRYYEAAMYGLSMGGLIPNFGKTFTKGFFRESCGVDAYRGKDVTPFRMKVGSINSCSDGESLCDLAKRLVQGGFADTSALIYLTVSRALGRLSMTNDPNCQGLVQYVTRDFGWLLINEPRLRFNADTQSFEVPSRRTECLAMRFSSHAWWHVQESLLKVATISPTDPTIVGSISDRGLEYPHPRGERSKRGYSRVINPSSTDLVYHMLRSM